MNTLAEELPSRRPCLICGQPSNTGFCACEDCADQNGGDGPDD